MNDLRELMDRAAGEPTALSEAELRKFARQGRRAVRRRRFTVGTGAVAVTAAAATGWALLPAGPVAGLDPADPVTGPSTPTLPSTEPQPPIVIRPPARPTEPVALVPDGIRRRNTNDNTWSSLVCGLKPKGWTVEAVRIGAMGDPKPDGPDLLTIQDKSQPGDAEGFDKLHVSVDRFSTAADGSKIVPKMGGGWDDHVHYQAGPYQAVINGSRTKRVPLSARGDRDMFLRVGTNTLLHVWTVAPRLGWDLKTALRFAGSCRVVG